MFNIESIICPADTFERIPKPESGQFYKYVRISSFFLYFLVPFSRFGTHAVVCCPGYSSSAIFFPSDPSHPEYGAGEDFDYEDVPEFNTDIQIPEIPKVTFTILFNAQFSVDDRLGMILAPLALICLGWAPSLSVLPWTRVPPSWTTPTHLSIRLCPVASTLREKS